MSILKRSKLELTVTAEACQSTVKNRIDALAAKEQLMCKKKVDDMTDFAVGAFWEPLEPMEEPLDEPQNFQGQGHLLCQRKMPTSSHSQSTTLNGHVIGLPSKVELKMAEQGRRAEPSLSSSRNTSWTRFPSSRVCRGLHSHVHQPCKDKDGVQPCSACKILPIGPTSRLTEPLLERQPT
jgi:hypothetical protein